MRKVPNHSQSLIWKCSSFIEGRRFTPSPVLRRRYWFVPKPLQDRLAPQKMLSPLLSRQAFTIFVLSPFYWQRDTGFSRVSTRCLCSGIIDMMTTISPQQKRRATDWPEFHFQVTERSEESDVSARCGVLTLPHATVETPVL